MVHIFRICHMSNKMNPHEYLEPFNDGGSLTVYKFFNKEKYTCTDYAKFTQSLVDSLVLSDFDHGFFVDWTSCLYHTIVFDIDLKCPPECSQDTSNLLLHYLDVVFLGVLREHFGYCLSSVTVIVSMRRDRSGGMHVHLPGVVISHDDYVHLCDRMREACVFRRDGCVFTLDCPSTMCLVASDKPGVVDKGLYVPVRFLRLRFVQGMDSVSLQVSGETESVVSSNESLFDDLSLNMSVEHVARYMMPVEDPQSFPTRLFYPTWITRNPDYQVAYFDSNVNNLHYYIAKSNRLLRNLRQSNNDEGPFAHEFLKRHADSIEKFCTSNRILKTWFRRYSSENETGFFGYINRNLRHKCVHLRNETNPLRTIMLGRYGTYFLPVFYALCNEKKRHTLDVVSTHLKNEILSNDLTMHEKIPECIPSEGRSLTFNTILYCAFKTVPMKTKEGLFIQFIGTGWDWVFESIVGERGMRENIRFVQERYFPIVKGYDQESNRNSVYHWDPFTDEWYKIEDKEKEVRVIVENVFYTMKFFEGYNKLAKDIRDRFEKRKDWVNTMTQDIMSKLKHSQAIPANVLTEVQHYKENVPEFYFFGQNFHSSIYKT